MTTCKQIKEQKKDNTPSRVDSIKAWLEKHRYRLESLEKGHIEIHFGGVSLRAKFIESHEIEMVGVK